MTTTRTIWFIAVYYRGEGEKNWRLLKDKLTQRYYSWDTTTMPDGAYYLKIVASDSPSNPPTQALTNERESERFEIENTPPRIENLRADASLGGGESDFRWDQLRRCDCARAIQRGRGRLDHRFPGRLALRCAEGKL